MSFFRSSFQSAKTDQSLSDFVESLHIILETLRDSLELTPPEVRFHTSSYFNQSIFTLNDFACRSQIPPPGSSPPPVDSPTVELLITQLTHTRLLNQSTLEPYIDK